MKLWIAWYQAVSLLRPAFSRQVTFLWFGLAVMGISVRRDRLGVTSIVRSLALSDSSYHCLLGHFRSGDQPGEIGQSLDILRVHPVWLKNRTGQRAVYYFGRWEENCQTRAEDAWR